MSKSIKKIKLDVSELTMSAIDISMDNIRFYCKNCKISCCYTPEYSLMFLKENSCPKCNGKLVGLDIPKKNIKKI